MIHLSGNISLNFWGHLRLCVNRGRLSAEVSKSASISVNSVVGAGGATEIGAISETTGARSSAAIDISVESTSSSNHGKAKFQGIGST